MMGAYKYYYNDYISLLYNIFNVQDIYFHCLWLGEELNLLEDEDFNSPMVVDSPITYKRVGNLISFRVEGYEVTYSVSQNTDGMTIMQLILKEGFLSTEEIHG
jgi:hypothetical protein